jgi:hypothetical protein
MKHLYCHAHGQVNNVNGLLASIRPCGVRLVGCHVADIQDLKAKNRTFTLTETMFHRISRSLASRGDSVRKPPSPVCHGTHNLYFAVDD